MAARSRGRRIVVASIAILIAAGSAVALARATALKLTGPRSGTPVASLRVTVSGDDRAPLNHLFVVSADPPAKWGYLGQRSPSEPACAPNSTAEVSNSATLRYLINADPVAHGRFSRTVSVPTANVGARGIAVCAYLYVEGRPAGPATVVASYVWKPHASA